MIIKIMMSSEEVAYTRANEVGLTFLKLLFINRVGNFLGPYFYYCLSTIIVKNKCITLYGKIIIKS